MCGLIVRDIHVRLRPGKDDDLARWYESLEQKSATVREALRRYIQQVEDSSRRAAESNAGREKDVLLAGDGQLLVAIDRVVKEAVVEAVSRELDDLPFRISLMVREVLAQDKGAAGVDGSEDPELATRLDEQLDSFFSC